MNEKLTNEEKRQILARADNLHIHKTTTTVRKTAKTVKQFAPLTDADKEILLNQATNAKNLLAEKRLQVSNRTLTIEEILDVKQAAKTGNDTLKNKVLDEYIDSATCRDQEVANKESRRQDAEAKKELSHTQRVMGEDWLIYVDTPVNIKFLKTNIDLLNTMQNKAKLKPQEIVATDRQAVVKALETLIDRHTDLSELPCPTMNKRLITVAQRTFLKSKIMSSIELTGKNFPNEVGQALENKGFKLETTKNSGKAI